MALEDDQNAKRKEKRRHHTKEVISSWTSVETKLEPAKRTQRSSGPLMT